MRFFSVFGRLLYSIACADGEVDLREKKFIENQFLKLIKKHRFGAGDTFRAGLVLSKLVFEKSCELKLNPQLVFEGFIQYSDRIKHPIMNSAERDLCIKLLSDLAAASNGIVQLEKDRLEKSITLFNSIYSNAE